MNEQVNPFSVALLFSDFCIITIKKLCDGLEITLIVFFDTEEFRVLEQEIQ